MRDLYIGFTSSCFLFPVRVGSEKLEDWVGGGGEGRRGGGLKNFRTRGIFAGGSVPHYIPCLKLQKIFFKSYIILASSIKLHGMGNDKKKQRSNQNVALRKVLL